MEWNRLLEPRKYGDKQARSVKGDPNRSVFEQDYDRIIFSTPFRSLQDKTQVIPLPEQHFVHNRLTHSIEVSSVGRTLGKLAGSGLLQKYKDLADAGITHHDLGAIVAAASLAHDIGNPPFGHSGETAIGEFFLEGAGRQYQELLTPSEWADLTRFEGNANGFRILTHKQGLEPGGLRLSYPTLGAFTKYPKESLPVPQNKGRASEKKYGFFQSEKDFFEDMAMHMQLLRVSNTEQHYRRHPLAFLVEAADDICYHIIDFEDGIRLNWISLQEAEALLIPIAGNVFLAHRYRAIQDTEEKAAYLRAVAINNLIREMAAVFLEQEEAMRQGSFDTSLIKLSSSAREIEEIKKLSFNRIYKARGVVEIEAAGFEVIGGLLEMFTRALWHVYEKGNARSAKHAELLPAYLQQKQEALQHSPYLRLMAVCSYVAGLTDRHAISLYRKMKGIELPRT